MQNGHTTLDPLDDRLHIHKLVRALPALADDDARFEKLCDGVIDRQAVIEPIKITPAYAIADGRHRWRAAKRAQLKELPAIFISEDEVATIALRTLIDRRHFTKGQLAYVAYPLFQAAHEETKKRRFEALKKGPKTPVGYSVTNGKIEDFATELRISRELFKQAARVHTLFFEDPEFKAQMEPKLLDPDDPVGLGAIIAGYGGQKAQKGKARHDNDPEQLFFEGFNSLVHRALKLPEVKEARKAIRDVVGKITSREELDDLLSLASEIESAVKARTRELAS